jgi:glycosyltransferase involved in cell wall biosynthesis
MLEIALFFREKRNYGFSIEEIFNVIEKELSNRVVFKRFYVNGNKSRLWNIIAASKIKADVYHITGDCHYLALGLASKKTILTIHDTAYYENVLIGFKKWLYGLFWFKLPLNKAGYITCISNFTKNKIIELFDINPAKISVIYNPYSNKFHFNSNKFKSENPVILQIGFGIQKNTKRLIEAISDIECQLLLINGLTESVEEQLKNCKISYLSKSNLSFDEVYDAYCFSDIVFFASTYEGFGLPIIEANATGRVVITSNITSMPEIARDSAYLVNPYNVSEIKNAVKELIENGNLRSELIANGFENIKRFESNKIADEYLELYYIISHKIQ